MELKFKKYSGAGNDFVLIDEADNNGVELSFNLITKLCDRRNGIGADGILFIKDSDNLDFELYYYNADGSLGSLCGNGSRCAIKYAFLSKRFAGNKTKFLCGNKIYSGEVFENGDVKFHLQNPTKIELNLKIDAFNQNIDAAFADTGSPHVVVKVEKLLNSTGQEESRYTFDDLPVFEYGKILRHHKLFEPNGTNVNFIEVIDNIVFIRTYERGVEDETLACGTGSVASALIVSLTEGLESPISVITRGGDELKVEFSKKNNLFDEIALIGPAKEVFSGIIYL